MMSFKKNIEQETMCLKLMNFDVNIFYPLYVGANCNEEDPRYRSKYIHTNTGCSLRYEIK